MDIHADFNTDTNQITAAVVNYSAIFWIETTTVGLDELAIIRMRGGWL